MKQFDIIVIGMGPAGMAVSAMGSAMGLSVLAIEKHKVGGECLNCGCIPSKALLESSERYAEAKNLQEHGIGLEGIRLDLAAMMQRKQQVDWVPLQPVIS